MKRKILSIFLIIFMLSASLITIPVNAKILNDGDNSWINEMTFNDEVFEDGVYDTLADYANIHCGVVYEPTYVEKLFISGKRCCWMSDYNKRFERYI